MVPAGCGSVAGRPYCYRRVVSQAAASNRQYLTALRRFIPNRAARRE